MADQFGMFRILRELRYFFPAHRIPFQNHLDAAADKVIQHRIGHQCLESPTRVAWQLNGIDVSSIAKAVLCRAEL